MQARDLLKEMEKMEESGMERPWVRAVADTIVKAIEPLATRSDLEELRKEMRAANEGLRKEIKGVDENLRKDMNAGFELVREQMKSLESGLKVWMLASQIILFGGLVATNIFL